MFGTQDLILFVISGLLLNITPGPDVLYVAGRSAAQGFRAGVWAALGIGAGCFVHIGAAAMGLSAILATSAMAFTIVKWMGAAYLVYLGVSMILARRVAPVAPIMTLPLTSLQRIFWQGFLTNTLNPKVALFFLAFVPQFIDPTSQAKVMAFLFLGLVFNVNGTFWNVFVAWMSARLLGHLTTVSAFSLWLNRALGGLFIGLGVKLALSEQNG